MTTPHKWAAEIHAVADGKEVEGHSLIIGNACWRLASKDCNPLSHPHYLWRIKPEKKVLRYRVAILEKDGQKFTQTADSTDDAIELASCPYFSRWVTVWIEVEVE